MIRPARPLALCLMGVLSLVAAHAEKVETTLNHKNSTYTVTYDTEAKTLRCASNNVNAVWRAQVGSNVPGRGAWSGTATAAGPVFVYTSGGNTSFALLRFDTGAATVEQGGGSLRGGLAAGRLVSASWADGPYGSRVTAVTLKDRTEYTTVRDINMWGTGQQESRTSRTLPVAREQLPGTTVSFEVPPGFSFQWDADSDCMLVLPDDGRRIGMLLHAAPVVGNLTEFADGFMDAIGPAMGASDLRQTAASNVTIGGTMPGLLRTATATMEGMPGSFVFVFVSATNHTIVLLAAGPTADFDQHAANFYKLVGGVQM
jgi:hypothetical protein